VKSLSDVVGAAGLQGYAEVALVLFLVVFIAVVARALSRRGQELDRIARLPLDDDATSTSTGLRSGEPT